MNDIRRELAITGKVEISKELTQEEIDSKIITKIDDIKYGYLELGGYLKVAKDVYDRETIRLYNEQNGTEIKVENVENIANYSRMANRNFNDHCKNIYGMTSSLVWTLVNVYKNFDTERIALMPKSAKSYSMLNKLTLVENNEFKIEDFLSLTPVSNTAYSDKKNKDLTWRELEKERSEYMKLTKEYNNLEKELSENNQTLEDKLVSEEQTLKESLMNELKELRKYKTTMEKDKDKVVDSAIKQAVAKYEDMTKAFDLQKQKLELSYGKLDDSTRKLEKKQNELEDLERSLTDRLTSLPSNEDVLNERKELIAEKSELLKKRAELSNELANISNEITELGRKKLDTVKSIENLQNDLKDLAPFRDKMQYLYKNINLIKEIQERLNEILSQDYSDFLNYQDVKESYLATMDNLVATISEVYAKFGESSRVMMVGKHNIIEQQ